MRSDARLILMLGPSLNYQGGMTEVIRAYFAAGVFEVWPLRYVSTYQGRGLLTVLRAWLPALCRALIGLIHVHSAAYGSFWRKSALCAMAVAFGVPYVIHLHDGRLGDFYQRGCSGLAKSWVRAVLRKAARVVVLSRHWRDEVRKIEPAARTTIIGNPIPVPVSIAPLRRPARTVLFLAWLQREKGVLDLVRAIPIVLRCVPEASFVIAGRAVGDSETPDSILQFARSLRVEHSLRLPGWVDGSKKDDLLRDSDVFVLPSYGEALPLGVLEAMACGVPVIEDRVNGLLVAPGQPEALAGAMVAMLTDDALRSRLREAARGDVRKRFSTESVIKDLETLYRQLGIQVDSIKDTKACAA